MKNEQTTRTSLGSDHGKLEMSDCKQLQSRDCRPIRLCCRVYSGTGKESFIMNCYCLIKLLIQYCTVSNWRYYAKLLRKDYRDWSIRRMSSSTTITLDHTYFLWLAKNYKSLAKHFWCIHLFSISAKTVVTGFLLY